MNLSPLKGLIRAPNMNHGLRPRLHSFAGPRLKQRIYFAAPAASVAEANALVLDFKT